MKYLQFQSSTKTGRVVASRAVLVGAVVLGAGAIGCRTTQVRSGGASAPMPAVVTPMTADAVPAQTIIETRLNQPVGTDISRPGDRFTATVINDVVAANGEVVIPRGALVNGVVLEIDASSHVGDQAAIGLGFTNITFANRNYPFAAEVVETDLQQDRSGRDIATGAGGGALAGAVLGAILGGGSGAVKGGLAGAGGGSLIALGAGDVQARLPAGSVLTLRVMQPIDIH